MNTWYTRGQWLDVLCIPKSECCCLFIPLVHFSFSPIFKHKNFRHTFFRNCEAYKVETWHTSGQRLDVVFIPKSGCCCLFVPAFLHFSFSNFQILKDFCHFLSGSARPTKLKVGTQTDNGKI